MADDFFKKVYGSQASSAPVNAPMPTSSGKKRRKGSSVLAGAAQSAPIQRTAKKDEGGNWWEDVINTPVIKEIVDALSTSTYAVGNYLNYQTQSEEDRKANLAKSVANSAKSGDWLGTALDVLGGSKTGAVGASIGKGLSAGLGGNKNDVKTASDSVKNIQKANGIDTESPESRNVQFWGGLAADIALDPLNVVGLGAATAATKGAVRGSKQFSAESNLARRTGALSESVADTRWGNVKKQAKVEINKYRQAEYDIQQAKQVKKKGTDADKAKFIVENLQTLRPAVLRSIAKSMDDKETVLAKLLDEGSESDMATMAAKLDETTPDPVPADLIDTPAKYKYEPQTIGLGVSKEPTAAEKLVDTLGEYRTTNRKPIYTPEQSANVERMVAAQLAKGVPAAKIKNSMFTDLGVKYEHIPLYKAGEKLEDITDNTSVGDLKAITRDIRNGVIPQKALAPLFEHVGSMEPSEIASFIQQFSKTEDFKEAAKNLGKYGTKRTGETPLPWIGVSGHGKLAIPGQGFTQMDILAAKTPANPEQSRKFLESRYQQSALELASNPIGTKLRTIADDIFKETIDVQRIPAGPRRTRRGASAPANLKGAKFETKYNTHSAMYRITRITDELRALQKAGKLKTQYAYDDAYMQLLKDIDDRLRLAGFDPHLSNMAIQGDKLVVRLAPSDVFGLMTKADRIRYIHGNKAHREFGKEFLPTTLLDLAEVLVRSATKLTPEGKIDIQGLVQNAIHTLQGSYSKVASGKREILSNLDINTFNKNHEEILRAIDNDRGTTYLKTFKETKDQKAKNALIDVVRTQNPDIYKKHASQRLDSVTNELIAKFTKGMADGRPSILSGLVNTNMRNASVFGGTVAKQIGEASAEYSAKVLNALDTGTVGDFLSALVAKPPMSLKDISAQRILADNADSIRASVANADEVAHAKALNANVNGEGTAAANNAKAYRENGQLKEELAKHPSEMNTEKVFDLTLRELNADILIRSYGTSRFFNKRSGMPRSFEVLESSSHASSLLMTGFHGILRDFRAKGYNPEQLRVAMKEVQSSPQAVASGDPIAVALEDIMWRLFDPSKNNFMTRNSVGPAHFNTILEKVGFSDKYRVPVNATPQEMNNIWRSWDITHVEDFLSKLMGAMVKTSEDISMGASFTRHFGSDVPAPGFRKIVDPRGKNPLFPLIDQTKYYPVEVAEEMVHIGRLMTESRSFKPGTPLHTFVTKVMDPTISTLKMTQTTMKPGHHVMSIIGDTWRNNLALSTIGFLNPARQSKLYYESARILRSSVGDIEELSEFQKFKRIQDIAQEIKLDANAEGATEFFANIGKGGKVSHQKLYEIMQATGVALPAHLGGMAEDFLTDFDAVGGLGAKTGNMAVDTVTKVTTGIDRLVNPLKPKFGMKNPYSLNKFTANRDTWTRGALFLGAMRSRQFRNLDDAVEFASNFVRKWAPTAVDLAAAETKYARRLIFYYTWIRGMAPRIIESALMRPGIATIPNKAMYEMAKSNGIDLQSIGDPFPDDQLFPEWYTERVIGPQYISHDGDLWGANPTGPLGDILNSLGSNVKPKDFVGIDAFTKTAGTFLNMSTPWIKAPIELTTGHTIDRNIPVPDRLQYLQDMVGPARTLSRATGKELYLAPGPEGLERPNRTESKFKNGLTPEETTQNALPELLNWATGLGFTNYTSDSAEKSAQFQEKAALDAEQKKYDRFK